MSDAEADVLQQIQNDENIPESGQAVAHILRTMGVQDCEPLVVHQIMEFMHTYIRELLKDAETYSLHAHKKTIDVEDIQYAINSRVKVDPFARGGQLPPLDFIQHMADATNKLRLPTIPQKFGALLPPEPFCLSEVNYQITGSRRGAQSQPRPQSQPPPPPMEG
eukprot:TRINITY_DN16723_c0_g1_i1.p1 TRINITY_DN16723_c0_g1~~TRINITY_DN16723_c0_g1_i1.p1  ORF type:complete len:164 (-),score=24.61 TRINITY_DN16723_c0_g1_i1:4-495(-)